MFDLIIANPPYGQNSTLATKINTAILPLAESIVTICPISGYKFFKAFDKIDDIQYLDSNPFKDASFTAKLVIVRLGSGKKQISNYKEMNLLDNPLLSQYLEANNKLPCCFESHEYVCFSSRHMTLEEVHEYAKKWDRDRIFIQTSRNNFNNVHSKEGGAFDVTFNVEGSDWSISDQSVYVFRTKQERDNFCNWYYLTAWKDKDALVRKLMRLYCKSNGVDSCWFPNVDWSHPWTDEEIIEELKDKAGLPEDFLKDS